MGEGEVRGVERRSSGGAHVVMAEFGTQRSTCHGESPPPASGLSICRRKKARERQFRVPQRCIQQYRPRRCASLFRLD